ncbi:MAG: FtsX-like permease family protein [Burkholderiaceae bacterium]
MIALWFRGLVQDRRGRLAGTIAGIALAVAMFAALGAFLTHSAASMTHRAISGVPVDWQVQIVPGISTTLISRAIEKAVAVSQLQTVAYANVESFDAKTGVTTQTTGQGKVLGFDVNYAHNFPGQFRSLLGNLNGVMIAQQTAANLHVTVGETVTIHRTGLPPVAVKVAGIVDLPNANSMFQAVGVPPGAAPQAPPDNVMLLPMTMWHGFFDPQSVVRPDSVRMQLHVGLRHDSLPDNPEAAFISVQGAARNLEARIAGNGIVADNLAARLDSVRSDALYSKVLFLFLGAPGVLLAAFLTVAVAASGGERRRRDQALLRLRGASQTVILKLAAVEAAYVGLIGAIAGVGLAALSTRLLLGIPIFDGSVIAWVVLAVLAGFLLATGAIITPAWIDARNTTVTAARMTVAQDTGRTWRRIGLDYLLIGLAAIVFWRTWSTGYQVVLAPEGTAASLVDYQSFLAPVLLWIGIGLLTIRVCRAGLVRGRSSLTSLLQPIAGTLSGVVAAAMGRQRGRITQGVALVALSFAFATSTAIFNTTYHAQAQVDAELTNGADVAVTGSMLAPASARLKELAALPGVMAAQPMQHRLAYVGNDLQDLFGIDARHIGDVTRISDAYFENGNAKNTLAILAKTPDGILVSDETVKDFQLQLGDELNLRLQNGQDHQYHKVKFHFVGIVREFPTAPRDSFIVANADYIAQQTHADGAEVVLLKATASPAEVSVAARKIVASLPGVKVSDISQARHLIGSSLTSVDLTGLTRLELGFAILMVAGATGLILALGLADRQRIFAILSALGAKPPQLSAFLWSEALFVFLSGAIVGTTTGLLLAWMLIKLLTGIFDPPPEYLSVPWLYLALLVSVAFLSTAVAVKGFQRETKVSAVQRMREI